MPWGMAVSPSGLEAIVKHDGRLNVLSVLLDGGPLSVDQLASQIDESPRVVRYWVHLLESYGLVLWLDLGDSEEMYEATLLVHPDWVQDAVTEHCRR